MNNNKYYLIKKLIIAREYLFLAKSLLKKRSSTGIICLIQKALDETPCFDEEDIRLAWPTIISDCASEKRSKIKRVLADVFKKAIEELKVLLEQMKDEKYFSKISLQLILSFPATLYNSMNMTESDKVCIYLNIPWKDLLFSENSQINLENIIYKYILNMAFPILTENDLYNTAKITISLDICYVNAFELYKNASIYRRLTTNDAKKVFDSIFHHKEYEQIDDLDNMLIEYNLKFDKYIQKIINDIDVLIKRPTSDSNLYIKMVNKVYDKIKKLLHKLEIEDKYNGCFGFLFQSDQIVFDKNACFRAANIDRIMRIIERESVLLDKRENRYVKKLDSASETKLDANYHSGSKLTFWTKKEGFPVPFWSSFSMSFDLFNSKESWHENYPYSPLCYLSHVALVDSCVPFTELQYLDYIEWRTVYVREFSHVII